MGATSHGRRILGGNSVERDDLGEQGPRENRAGLEGENRELECSDVSASYIRG